MNWTVACEAYQRALRRTSSLLLALAAVAGQAAGRSLARRAFVWWVLAPALAAAQEHVWAEAERAGLRVPPSAMTEGGDLPAFARRFRTLATVLRRVAVRLRRMARRKAEPQQAGGEMLAVSLPVFAAPGFCADLDGQILTHDTS